MNYIYYRPRESLLTFAYKGEVKANEEILAPLAVLAERVRLNERLEVCANEITKWCVFIPCLLIAKCVVQTLH